VPNPLSSLPTTTHGNADLQTDSGEDAPTTAPLEVILPSSTHAHKAVTGFVKCNKGKLVGTFDIGGRPRYLSVDVKPLNQSFECDNAILICDTVEQMFGDCKWVGTVGKDDLEMDFTGGVSIKGPLTTPRPSSMRIRGAGTWNAKNSTPPLLPAITANYSQGNVASVPVDHFPAQHAVRNPVKLLRERQLLESGAPIIAYAQPASAYLATH